MNFYEKKYLKYKKKYLDLNESMRGGDYSQDDFISIKDHNLTDTMFTNQPYHSDLWVVLKKDQKKLFDKKSNYYKNANDEDGKPCRIFNFINILIATRSKKQVNIVASAITHSDSIRGFMIVRGKVI